MQINLTDQDPQEHNGFCAKSGSGKVFPLAVHCLCAWHKLNKNLKEPDDFKSKIKSMRKKNCMPSLEFDAICNWLWSMISEVETEEEADHAGQMGGEFCQQLSLWVTEKLADTHI